MIKFFLVAICSIFIFGCSASTEDCICTMEFRMITVNISDQNNNPVRLDSIIIVNKRTEKNYYFSDEIFPGAEGVYAVMTDAHVNEISTGGDEVLFKGFAGNDSIETIFIISTDECKCHVHKTAGPDSLFMNL